MLLKTLVSCILLFYCGRINLDGHRPRVRRYAHGLRKLIRIGHGEVVAHVSLFFFGAAASDFLWGSLEIRSFVVWWQTYRLFLTHYTELPHVVVIVHFWSTYRKSSGYALCMSYEFLKMKCNDILSQQMLCFILKI